MSLTEDIDLKDLVRTIPDYPKPGIMFRDITTLLGHANGLRACIEPSWIRRAWTGSIGDLPASP